VLNALSLLCCNILGIAGVIVTSIALSKINHDVPGARTLVRWGWGLLAAMFVLLVVFILISVARYGDLTG
jgi:hypothetical protein